MTTAVLWFRRDLRLSDHPALRAAVDEADEVVGFFCLDNRLRDPSGPARLAFLYRCLRSLDDAMDGELVIRTGVPATKVRALARQVGAERVYVTADFGRYGRQRDGEVAEALAEDGAELVRVSSPYAVEPGTLTTKSTGEYYKVFSPFYRAWQDHGWDDPIPKPASIPWASADGDDVPAEPDLALEGDLPTASEDGAHSRLDHFLAEKVTDYDDQRDQPAEDATSRLSPYLKYGLLHPRQILDRLGRSDGEKTFEQELAWRDFYADVLWNRPDTVNRSYLEKMRDMPVDTGADADERFAAWAEGRTGYPIVDAGMRQLKGEAWMHNRVRMIVASFLVKDLHLDWHRGALHFMEHLVDGDTSSNHHGWQWAAGTGTDAAPYFRIFNPWTQGEKFDPDGRYIRRWVPELADVADEHIHRPADRPGGVPDGYPEPIVDHAEEREESLRRYDTVKD